MNDSLSLLIYNCSRNPDFSSQLVCKFQLLASKLSCFVIEETINAETCVVNVHGVQHGNSTIKLY